MTVSRTRTLVQVAALVAICSLPLAAHTRVAQNSPLGLKTFSTPSHQGFAEANPLIAPGLAESLCHQGVRSRCSAKERDAESDLDYFLARYYGSSLGRFNSVDPANAGADPANPQSWNAYAYVNNNPLIFVDPDGLALTIVTFEGEDLTDEQRLFIEENREQIQQTIADRFKEAGVEDVFFLSGSDLTDDQRAALTQRETTGIGLLNFVDTSIAGTDVSRIPSMKGGTSNQGTSAVFIGNLTGADGLSIGADLAFGVGEVSSHELGHQFGFPSLGETLNTIPRLFGFRDLMDEGQGNPVPGRPQFFNESDDVIRRFVREVNTRGSSISRRRK